MIRHLRVVPLACLMWLLSCGDDDGGGTTVKSGLPATEKLSSLDDADAKKLCTSLADSFNNVLSQDELERIACTVLALPLSIKQGSGGKIEGDVAKCKMLVSMCLDGEEISDEEPAFTPPEGDLIDEATCENAKTDANLDSCEANVGELERCASAQLRALSSRFDAFKCESLSDPEKLMEMVDEDPEDAPECESFYEKCPDVSFGDDGDDFEEDFEED